MPDERVIQELENLISDIVNLGGQKERTSIVPNMLVRDATPSGLDDYVIIADDRDGDNILALKVPGVIYSDNDLVNTIFPTGGEAIAFQQGSGSDTSGLWDIVTGTDDIYYDKGDVAIGKSVAPDAALEVLSASQAQLRLTHTEDTKYVDFTLDTNSDLTIKPSSTGGVIFQPTTDSTDFFQILDADGGTPIVVVDSTNERFAVGTLPTIAVPFYVKSFDQTTAVYEHETTATGGVVTVFQISRSTTGTSVDDIGVRFTLAAEDTGGTVRALAAVSARSPDITNVDGVLFFSTRDNLGALTEQVTIDEVGKVGIKNTDPPIRLTVQDGASLGAIRMGADLDATTLTDSTRKIGRLVGPHYDTDEQDIYLFGYDSQSGFTRAQFGGGTGSLNAATTIQLITAATTTTLSGTVRVIIDENGDVKIANAASSPASLLEVETDSAYGKQAVTIDQNDADEAFIDYQGTSAASAANNISTWTTGNSIQGFYLIEINGVQQWAPYYDAPTS